MCLSSVIHFCNSSALRVALLGFLFSWKCLTGGVRGPTRVVNALLLRYWHSRGSMADASHSPTGEKSKLRYKVTIYWRRIFVYADLSILSRWLTQHAFPTFLPQLSQNILHIWILLLQIQIERPSLWEGLEDIRNHQDPGFRIHCR